MFHIFLVMYFSLLRLGEMDKCSRKAESIRDFRGWQAKAFKSGTGGMQLRDDEGAVKHMD